MELGLEFLTPDIQKKLMEEQLLNPKKQEDPINNDTETPIIDTTNNNNEHKEERDDASSKAKNSSPYVLLGKHLIEEGLLSEELSKELEEDPTIEGLTSALTRHLDTIASAKISQYEPEVQEFIDLVKNGVDKETAKAIMKESVDLEKITDDVLENSQTIQENIARQYLGKLGMSTDEIDEQIEYFKDTDKLYTKSSLFKDKLSDLNKKEKQTEIERATNFRKQQEEANKDLLGKIKTQVESYEEIIPGIKLPKATKDKIFKNLTTPVAMDDNGNPVTFVQSVRAKDPIKFEILLNYFADQGFFEGKFDNVLKGTKSKTIEELEKTLSSSTLFDKGISTISKTASDGNDETTTKDLATSIPGSMDELLKFYNKK